MDEEPKYRNYAGLHLYKYFNLELELYAVKVAPTVPRRGDGCEAVSLSWWTYRIRKFFPLIVLN